VNTKLTHVQVNGGLNDQTDPGVEANLDVQCVHMLRRRYVGAEGPSASRYTEGLTYPTPNIYYSLVFCMHAGPCAESNPSGLVDLPRTTRTTPILPMTTSVSECLSDVRQPCSYRDSSSLHRLAELHARAVVRSANRYD
jgi:hypothetical protein